MQLCKTDIQNIQQVDYKTSEMSTSELSSFMDKMKMWAQSELGCYLPYFGDPGYEEMVSEYNGVTKQKRLFSS